MDPKGAAVDEDPVFKGVMRAAPAVAWEDGYSERVPVDVHPKVRVPDSRPNEVLEERAMCSQEKSGLAWEELPWHLHCMRRDRGKAGLARYAVLAKLVEAACVVSYSVLLDLLGKFVFEFLLFCIRRPQGLPWSR